MAAGDPVTVVDLEDGDDWADLTTPTDERVLEVARAHGTVAAADWSGWSRPRIVELRKRIDGYDRGRGHPSLAELARRAPRMDCACTMCVEWRWKLAEHTSRVAATLGRPSLRVTDAQWMAQAACKGEDPRIWFPPMQRPGRPGHNLARIWGPARSVCDACPVADECRAYAVINQIDDGMWGGTTPAERDPKHRNVNETGGPR